MKPTFPSLTFPNHFSIVTGKLKIMLHYFNKYFKHLPKLIFLSKRNQKEPNKSTRAGNLSGGMLEIFVMGPEILSVIVIIFPHICPLW